MGHYSFIPKDIRLFCGIFVEGKVGDLKKVITR